VEWIVLFFVGPRCPRNAENNLLLVLVRLWRTSPADCRSLSGAAAHRNHFRETRCKIESLFFRGDRINQSSGVGVLEGSPAAVENNFHTPASFAPRLNPPNVRTGILFVGFPGFLKLRTPATSVVAIISNDSAIAHIIHGSIQRTPRPPAARGMASLSAYLARYIFPCTCSSQ